MASNRKQPKHKTALNSDCLTGEWLVRGTLRYLVKGYNPSRPDLPVTYAPIRLHQRRPQATATRRNVAGNPSFSPEFSKYLESIADTTKRANYRYQMEHWWTPPWAEPELRALFPEDAVNLFLAVRVNGVSLTTALRMTDYTMAEWQRFERKMKAHCQIRIEELTRRASRA